MHTFQCNVAVVTGAELAMTVAISQNNLLRGRSLNSLVEGKGNGS
jgi:hypothetical protein